MKFKKTLSTVAMVATLSSGFMACDQQSPLQQSNETELTVPDNGLQFLSLGKGMSSLKKVVETKVLITKKHGGKLKLKHDWTNADGKKVKVDIELKVKKDSISEDAEFILSLDEEMFITAFDVTFHPHGILFLENAELKIKAEGLDLDGVNEDTFGLYYDNDESGEWEMMEWKKLKIDTKKGKIELDKGKLPHFSRYAMAWSN